MICFSNKFSTFTEKSIFISFETGKRDALFKGPRDEDSNSTYIEDSTDKIYDNLYNVINGQTQYRLVRSHFN